MGIFKFLIRLVRKLKRRIMHILSRKQDCLSFAEELAATLSAAATGYAKKFFLIWDLTQQHSPPAQGYKQVTYEQLAGGTLFLMWHACEAAILSVYPARQDFRANDSYLCSLALRKKANHIFGSTIAEIMGKDVNGIIEEKESYTVDPMQNLDAQETLIADAIHFVGAEPVEPVRRMYTNMLNHIVTGGYGYAEHKLASVGLIAPSIERILSVPGAVKAFGRERA